jgi:hypothetical protein
MATIDGTTSERGLSITVVMVTKYRQANNGHDRWRHQRAMLIDHGGNLLNGGYGALSIVKSVCRRSMAHINARLLSITTSMMVSVTATLDHDR